MATTHVDTTSSGGKLVFHLFAALAEFERGVIRERTLAGLRAARARGRAGGRPPALGAKDLAGGPAGSRGYRGQGRPTPDGRAPPPSTATCPGPASRPWEPSRAPPMPIRPELRWFYPIDWPQVSRWVRFVRAGGRCEACGRPHGGTVRTWATAAGGRGGGRPGARPGPRGPLACPGRGAPVRTTRVVLAAAHLDHDPAHCGRRHRNVRALCQRCHLLHDRPEHRRRIRLTLRRRRALGDLFSGPYPSW